MRKSVEINFSTDFFMLFFLLCITSRHRRVSNIFLLRMINHLRNPIEELIVFQQNLNILIFE